MFKVEQKLGEGGFGVVYKVTSRRTNRSYALKILDRVDQNTIREVNMLIYLSSYFNQDIVKYYDSFYYLNRFCILMEYIEGPTILNYFAIKRPLKIWVNFAKWLLSIINRLHRLNVVHRDIKPDNIIKSKTNYTLIDFGLSCQVNSRNILACKNKEQWSVAFSAPEVWSGQPIDFKANDCYMVGMTLYYIVAHQRVYFYQPYLRQYNKVVEGLLNPNPYNRLTTQRALNLLNKL